MRADPAIQAATDESEKHKPADLSNDPCRCTCGHLSNGLYGHDRHVIAMEVAAARPIIEAEVRAADHPAAAEADRPMVAAETLRDAAADLLAALDDWFRSGAAVRTEPER